MNFALLVLPILKVIYKTLCICVIEVPSGPKGQLGMMVPGHSHWLTVCSYSAWKGMSTSNLSYQGSGIYADPKGGRS